MNWRHLCSIFASSKTAQFHFPPWPIIDRHVNYYVQPKTRTQTFDDPGISPKWIETPIRVSGPHSTPHLMPDGDYFHFACNY